MKQILLMKSIPLILTLFISTLSLGQYYNPPSQTQFQIIKFSTLHYFTDNKTYTITYPISMKTSPDILISYNKFHLNHFYGKTIYNQAWHHIKTLTKTITQTMIKITTFNETRNATLQYFTFSLILSSIDRKYVHIINYEYQGPRLTRANIFWPLILPITPQPFKTCYIDPLHTKKSFVQFMMHINGYVAANIIYVTRQVNKYPQKYLFHFYLQSLPVTLYLYSDLGQWADKYFFSFLFFCPNSYIFKRKYQAEMHVITVGDQLQCAGINNFQGNKSFILKNQYNYTYFNGLRFMFPYMTVTQGFTFQFDLNITQKGKQRFIILQKICGFAEYNIFFITQKKCKQNRQLNQSTGQCVCNPNKNLYEINSQLICQFICPNNTYNFNNGICKTCKQAWNSYCTYCTNISCSQCQSNFTLQSNNNCLCTGDRTIINETCQLCSVLYSYGCNMCNSTQCTQCISTYKLLSDYIPSCINCQISFSPDCINCNQNSCLQTQNFTFYINRKVHQIGKSIYVQLLFNHPFNQITQIIPLQQNLLFYDFNQQISEFQFNKKHLYIKFDISIFNINPLINITVFNLNYLKLNQTPLSNNLSPFLITPYNYQQDTLELIVFNYLTHIIVYLYLASIIFSYGQLNSGYQLWFVLSYYIYIRDDYNGFVQEILRQLKMVKLFQFIDLKKLNLFNKTEYHEVNFKSIIFNENHTFIELAVQGFIIYAVSVLFALYLFNYIKYKNTEKYIIYSNYIKHYKQYIISNFFALYPALSIILAIQAEQYINTSNSILNNSAFININIILSIIVGIVMIVLPFYSFCVLFPTCMHKQNDNQQQKYSIIYNKIHINGNWQILHYFLQIFNCPIIVTVIFCLRGEQAQEQSNNNNINNNNLIQYILLALTLVHIIICIINHSKNINKLFFYTFFIKKLIFLTFQVLFMLITIFANDQDEQILNNYCIIIIIILLIYDIIESIMKVLRIFIINSNNYKQFYPNNKILPIDYEIEQNIPKSTKKLINQQRIKKP